jgi:hypothetical protein
MFGSRTRRTTSIALLVLAAITLAAAIASVYVDRNLFSSAGFADNAQAALDEPPVRDLAAERITDEVIAEIDPDAIAIRPVIETVASSVLDSAAFGRVFRGAALQLHGAAVNGDLDGAVLTVANVGVLLSQALEKISPSIARQIPDGLDSALVRVSRVGTVSRFASAARSSHTLAWLMPLLSILLVIAAFAIAPDRRAAIAQAGFATIGSAGVLIVAFAIAQTATVRALGAQGPDREAADAIWDTFMNGLIKQAIVLALLGCVIVAVSDSAVSGVRLNERLHNFRNAIDHPPANRWLRAAWGVGAIVIGVLIALYPLKAVEVAALAAGVLLLARGLQELAMMAAPAWAVDAEKTASPNTSRRRRVRIAVISAGSLLAISAIVVGSLTINGGKGLQSLGLVTNTRACNGAESLCDKPFNDVALAMTHNSMADQTAPGWLFASQETPISTQLADGIRGLAIDVYYGFPGSRVYTDVDRSSPNAQAVIKKEFGADFVRAANRVRRSLSRPVGVAPRLYLCHGFCELGALELSTALRQINQFLRDYPREAIAVVFEDYVPAKDLAAALEKSGVAGHAYRGPWDGQWPKLGDMISRDQRVLLLTEHAKPTVPWMHSMYDVAQETPFNFRNVEQLRAPSSCDPLRGDPNNSLFLINHWVDTPPNPRPSIARVVNRRQFLFDRIRRCERRRGLRANMISVDFYKEGDLLGVVDELNGLN